MWTAGQSLYNAIVIVEYTVKVAMGVMKAMEFAAPGYNFVGIVTFASAGSTFAQVISGTLAGFGIIGGIWDIYNGISGMQGSERAMVFRQIAKEIDDRTDSYQAFLNMFSQSPRFS